MHIVDHDELRMRIGIQLKMLAGHQQRELGLKGERTANDAAAQIVARVFSGTVTVRPDLVEGEHRPGVFGLDEPHPFPDLVDDEKTVPVPRDPASRL
ncbi:hypothetical protein D1610_11460 [Sphingomonas gilva]|uniref:Uncharacterized protein n=1 Tax=Sphingomonas gilva TaxID=2305907 RepID=A0A396RLR5_9SPHN|nr:hypothetical protein [Sphingomonas gilva]RHW17159.1 hypothetical protein D1610_11460 [Sphingomonas gilva]